MTIVVSGANGGVGSRVVRILAERGTPQRLVVRNPDSAPDIPNSKVAVISDYCDAQRLVPALAGTAAVLMISGKEAPDRLDQHRAFVDSAVAAGVPHLVYTSFHGAAADSVFTHGRLHWATEQYIRESGIGFTFLRDNLYADFAPFLAGADGVISGPAGTGRASLVARDDVAAVAAEALLDSSRHSGAVYDLTGPHEFSVAELAAELTDLLGRPFSFQNQTIEEAYASRAHYGAPDWEVDAWVSTYTAIAAGEMSGISGDVQHVTGRPAMSLAEVLRQR